MKKKLSISIVLLFIILLTGCFDSDNEPISWETEDDDLSYMYIASDGLNVRKGPSADNDIVTVLHRNEKVTTDKVSHGGWYKITSVDTKAEGYVNASYLSDQPVKEEVVTAQKAEVTSVPVTTKEETAPATRSKTPEPAASTPVETSTIDTSQFEVTRPTLSKRPKN